MSLIMNKVRLHLFICHWNKYCSKKHKYAICISTAQWKHNGVPLNWWLQMSGILILPLPQTEGRPVGVFQKELHPMPDHVRLANVPKNKYQRSLGESGRNGCRRRERNRASQMFSGTPPPLSHGFHMCCWLHVEDHRAFMSVCMLQNPSLVNGIAPHYRHFALLLW